MYDNSVVAVFVYLIPAGKSVLDDPAVLSLMCDAALYRHCY